MKAIDYLSDPKYGLAKEIRKSQLSMTSAVTEVVEKNGTAIIEASTGTGKSLSYLLPIILSGRRAVISTAKKSLQDQLISKDIPAIAVALNKEIKAVVAKGKGSFVCVNAIEQGKLIDAKYLTWARSSKTADRAEYQGIQPTWASFSTAEQCIYKACKYYDKCGFIKNKSSLQDAQIIVTNHSLLGHELKSAEPKYFPNKYDVLVVDEAHKLADGLRGAFTMVLSQSLFIDIAETINKTSYIVEGIKEAKNALSGLYSHVIWGRPFNAKTWTLKAPVFDTGDASKVFEQLSFLRSNIIKVLSSVGITGITTELFWELFAEKAAGFSSDEKNDIIRLVLSYHRITRLEEALSRIQGLTEVGTATNATTEEQALAKEETNRIIDNTVIYAKEENNKISVMATPINLGPLISTRLKTVKSIVLTSATLAVENNFNHLRSELGLEKGIELVLPSNFDYKKSALLYVPKTIPEPVRSNNLYQTYLDMAADTIVSLCDASKGNAFVLFSANDELDALYKKTEVRLRQLGLTPFAQGLDGQPSAVLAAYMRTPNAVLFGSKSFYEGVDIQGPKLQLVIISKIPFPIEGDPIVGARKIKAGDKAFLHVNYHDAAIDLKQAAGRLIRSKTDRGVVAILDSRIWNKQYGGKFLSDLPFTNKTADINLTVNYLKSLSKWQQHKEESTVTSVQDVEKSLCPGIEPL